MPHKALAIGADGLSYYQEINGYYDVTINISSQIKTDPNGIIMISANQVYIGQEQRLKSDIYVFDSIVDNFKFNE